MTITKRELLERLEPFDDDIKIYTGPSGPYGAILPVLDARYFWHADEGSVLLGHHESTLAKVPQKGVSE